MFKDRAHWADKAFWWIAPIVIVASAAGGAWYYFNSRQPAAEPETKTEPAPASAGDAEPAIRHPVPGAATAGDGLLPVPPLGDSDSTLIQSLGSLFGETTVQRLLVPESVVRRIVVTVDNLPRQKIAVERRPLKGLGGATAVDTEGDLITLSEANFARYASLVQLVRQTDVNRLADLYFHYYPLFQQAYEDLGYPGQYFNDRLVEAIDTLLATPDVSGRIALVQPRVFHEFADPRLEARPAGQKLLLRMGSANAAVVKGKLRELRKAVTRERQVLPLSPGGKTGEPIGIVSPPGGQRHWL